MANEWNLGEKKRALVKEVETAVLVGLISQDQSTEQAIEYLDELEFLAQTAGAQVKKRFLQKLKHPDNRTFVGKGKAEEIREYVQEHDIDIVIFDDDLTAKQVGILEERMERKILDRSTLILDIFAARAQTAQAKVQVELAQMQYLLPRLRGMWDHLERQKGGIGMRGPGEKEIETDRRIVRDKVALLKKRLEKIDLQARTQRKNRGEMIRVSLVGYTNVGKSTLMNVLGKAEVLAENKLFATLDTTVRKVVVDRMPFLLSDTVGFIRKLPHHLVESFKSTLDEVRESDLLIQVVDISHPQHMEHIQVVNKTLKDLGASEIPMLYVFNKMDLYQDNNLDEFLLEEERATLLEELKAQWNMETKGNACFISALKKEGLEELREKLKSLINDLYVKRYPYKTRFW
ncbi:MULTISPECIES: GTPase HflX [unclassified Aureispira]|uniref:GTPase HflX n=1 Tax=unclassified Aureispira TaxID=2649989 RepID=UPI0006974843|nr:MULTISPECIES: GTPase HflX [unclassified Aureispira]WMX14795.1 GTPase HflX [Aureispira sp. CCB-E]